MRAMIARPSAFNGAAVVRPRRVREYRSPGVTRLLLQRGRGRETAERKQEKFAPSGFRSFNGAAVVRPRRAHLVATLGYRDVTFNGAAVVRPRRGFSGAVIWLSLTTFNGAAVVRPRRAARAVACRLADELPSTGPRS